MPYHAMPKHTISNHTISHHATIPVVHVEVLNHLELLFVNKLLLEAPVCIVVNWTHNPVGSRRSLIELQY